MNDFHIIHIQYAPKDSIEMYRFPIQDEFREKELFFSKPIVQVGFYSHVFYISSYGRWDSKRWFCQIRSNAVVYNVDLSIKISYGILNEDQARLYKTFSYLFNSKKKIERREDGR